jgi:L-ascorbate metabolism protein UlaG (beta-lactamase superfamily)
MSPYHLNPLDAVLVHQYVRARRSIGYAWGTFKMGDEPIWEPVERLARELKRARLPELAFTTLKHGETAEFDTSTAPRVQSSGFSK